MLEILERKQTQNSVTVDSVLDHGWRTFDTPPVIGLQLPSALGSMAKVGALGSSGPRIYRKPQLSHSYMKADSWVHNSLCQILEEWGRLEKKPLLLSMQVLHTNHHHRPKIGLNMLSYFPGPT